MRKASVAILLVFACCGGRPRLTVSKETTYFTGPLRPDGSVDYAAALNELYGSGVTPETNAAVPLAAILGDAVPEPVAERMGLRQAPPPPERFLGGIADWSKYIEWRRARGRPLPGTDDKAAGKRLDAELAAALQRPWSAKDHPLVAGWLEDMERPLEAVDRATRRPRHWIPITGPLSDAFMPSLLARRHVANALRSRAMLRLSEGDPDAAAGDVLAILRFASRQAQGPTLIEHLMAVAIAGLGADVLPLVAAHSKLSRDALRGMLTELEALEALPAPAEKIGRGERAMMLEAAVQTAFRGRGSGELDIGSLDRSLADWDEVLRMINRCYDAAIACLEAPTAEARQAACDERDRLVPEDKASAVTGLLKGGVSSTGRVMLVFQTIVAIALPSLGRTQVSFNEMSALDRLGRSGLVLRAYRGEKGRFPDRLEAVPASDLHGLSVAAREHGYRFAFEPGAKDGYTYTAMPEVQGTSGVRSFCVDWTGTLVTLKDGAEPEVRGARCMSISGQ